MVSGDGGASYQRSALILTAVALGLTDFCGQLIAAGSRRWHRIDDAALAEIKADCLRNLENYGTQNVSINDEAEIFRQARDNLEKLIDGAIAQGRQAEKNWR